LPPKSNTLSLYNVEDGPWGYIYIHVLPIQKIRIELPKMSKEYSEALDYVVADFVVDSAGRDRFLFTEIIEGECCQ